MAKKYRKKTRRSRRKSVTEPKVRVVGTGDGEVQLSLQIPQLLAATHGAVEAVAGEVGLLVIKSLIDEEVEQRAGRRYEHASDREFVRWGHEDGYVAFGGKKVPFQRPRVRSVGGGEIQVERYRMFQAERLEKDVARRVVRGVSTRNYEGVVDDLCDGYGVQKSSVSRQWKAATLKELTAMMERPLGDLDLAAIMIDGISFHSYMLVVALGIASDGKKHVLGIWDGATENGTVVTALLENLIERGLDAKRRYLFVIDGSKALRKGIVTVFGRQATIQRCQVHKERNVLSYLPEEHQATIKRALRAAWGMATYRQAKKALAKVVAMLDQLSPGAAASLREGLEETITIHRLNVSASLRKFLRTSNGIENIFARTRELCKNVKRWSSAEMALRWGSAMLLHAEKKFRRVIGHREMSKVIEALNNLDKNEAVA